jgi:Cys-tRNA(Pro)/Cys-tRNA(Cys) deacylase
MAVACIPVVTTLNLKRLAKACGAKKAALARPSKIPTVTGYILGAVSPIGQKLPLRTIVDASAALHSTIFVSGGRRGLEIEITYDALLGLSAGRLAKISV